MKVSAPRPQTMERVAYAVGEVAASISVSKGYLYKLAAQEKIKISKIGGRAVIFADEAQRFISEIKSAA